MNIAVIPARGGSKRIPMKNIREFAGKPIIAYSILAALGTGLFESVIVSTDDERIAEVASSYGAEVPFIRPPGISDDFTGTTPVFRHALQWCLADGRDVRAVCGVYATAPFVSSADIVAGHAALERGALAAISVTTFPYPIFRGLKKENGRVALIWPEHRLSRSQDLPECYHDCGQFYWATKEFLFSDREFMDGQSAGIPIPRHRVQDIDTLEDWRRAEIMHHALRETGEL
ncbi:MAG: pseudaminic acid cytidylyltransferase [Pseudodesulfovibrio sp.]